MAVLDNEIEIVKKDQDLTPYVNEFNNIVRPVKEIKNPGVKKVLTRSR